jgi:hypothetical protein
VHGHAKGAVQGSSSSFSMGEHEGYDQCCRFSLAIRQFQDKWRPNT